VIEESDGEIFVGGWIDDVPAARFKGYRMLLLGRILPQILFVLLLVFLTASAFILAYRSLRKQTQLNEMRSGFISNISHELKTPVSTVKVALEAIKALDIKKDASIASEYIAMSSKELKRLELLINKILDNSMIEHDSSILSFEDEDLNEVIKSSIDSIQPKIIDAGAKVSFKPSTAIVTACDPLYLQGVIINLIDNSLKYANGRPEVVISNERQAGDAVIRVSDKGPGIPEQYLERVFDKFFRIPTSNIHNVKGYGLGLSFASLIVKMHKGSIEVRNNKKGCTFTIVIPISKIEDQDTIHRG
jgi:signal transduction histidine kinase